MGLGIGVYVAEKNGWNMNPFDWWYQIYRYWMELYFEVGALRNCHNQNRDRIERIEKALRDET